MNLYTSISWTYDDIDYLRNKRKDRVRLDEYWISELKSARPEDRKWCKEQRKEALRQTKVITIVLDYMLGSCLNVPSELEGEVQHTFGIISLKD